MCEVALAFRRHSLSWCENDPIQQAHGAAPKYEQKKNSHDLRHLLMIYEEYLRHFRFYQTVNFKDKHFLKMIT